MVGDVVPAVPSRRRVDRVEPDRCHAEPREIIESARHSSKIAHAVHVGVLEQSDIDRVDRSIRYQRSTMPLPSLTSRARAAHRAPNGGKQPLPTLSRSYLTDLGRATPNLWRPFRHFPGVPVTMFALIGPTSPTRDPIFRPGGTIRDRLTSSSIWQEADTEWGGSTGSLIPGPAAPLRTCSRRIHQERRPTQ